MGSRINTSVTALAALAAAMTPAVLAAGGDAERPTTQQRISDTNARGLTPWKTLTTPTARGTKIVVSTTGNIISYVSPNQPAAQYEHIGVGAVGEGYVLCYTGQASSAYDTGDASSGFGAPTTNASQTSRKTLDNRLQLTQKFTLTPGSPTVPSNVLVTMSVKNLSGSPVNNVILRRQVDFDIDTGGAQGWAGFLSNHGRTLATVSAFHDPTEAPAGKESHGILMGVVQSAGTWYTRVTDSILDNTCNPTAAPLAANFVARGDYGDTIGFGMGTLNPGATKTVAIRYLRF
ncbi:hypothetical protein [Nostocoides veronense]|uniref:Uncharacterized protein n=1 Tax=Nostocoides veronense TaxID=330836 RepID=A0ABP4XLH0_9MICO